MHKLSTISDADIWQALERELGPPITTERPAGSVTVREFAQRYGCTERGAAAQLTTLMAQGKLRRVPFRSPGSTHPAYAYLAVEA
jgi:hypothetical protein